MQKIIEIDKSLVAVRERERERELYFKESMWLFFHKLINKITLYKIKIIKIAKLNL